MNKPEKRLIVALDVESLDDARALVKDLKPAVKIFKVGLILFSRYGSKAVEMVRDEGCEVFLDLKLHDIPNTVGKAVRAACDMGVFMLTVHASGGKKMVEAAVNEKAASETPYILGVTLLTSLDVEDMQMLGIRGEMRETITRLAVVTRSAGADGVVASPHEAGMLRKSLGSDVLIVTPGIRLEKSEDDQKRVMGPGEAIKGGADFIVVGRPVIKAEDPVKVAEMINREVSDAISG